MNKADLRKEPRLARARRGTLMLNGTSSACVIQDFSTKGFLIMATKDFAVGDVLELKSELYPGQTLQCKVEVRHITDSCLGTMVVELSDAAARLCRQFVEEHYSDRLNFG